MQRLDHLLVTGLSQPEASPVSVGTAGSGASGVPSPGALFAALRPWLPAFLSPRSLGWCEQVAASVPVSARSHYLECRPGTSERVDFMSCFETKTLAVQYRARLGVAPSCVWQSNLALLDAWADPRTALSHAARLWFEYDGSGVPATPHPDASPSVALESDYYMRYVRSTSGVAQRNVELLQASVSSLLPPEQSRLVWQAVKRCLDALGPDGGVGYLSVMSARVPVVAKLFVILPRTQVDEFLARIEWPGDRKAVRALLGSFYAASVRTAYLDLTLSDRVESRLGLATSQFQRRELALGEEASWLRLPESLGAESKELLRWPGTQVETLGATRVALRRWLDCKAVLEDDAVQHKAYLGFMPRFEARNG